MPSTSTLLALAAVAASASAFQGFNYGATWTDGTIKTQADFEAEFKAAASLPGTDGDFTSARLYTMIQGNTDNEPISAIPAAIKTKTSILFGLWASAGETAFQGELVALQKTIDQYCDQLDGLIAGISVGSEDLYRNSPTGMEANENPGTDPDVLVDYIERTREVIKGSCLDDAPIGHVDTWTVYVNGSNQAVIDALDWVGMDAYAYFESTKDNDISNGKNLFLDALEKTKAASGGKPVWITETGWPVSGETVGQGVASPENAEIFWQEVGCPLFGDVNTWWYTLLDAKPTTPSPSFGIIADLGGKPLHDLSCKDLPETTGSGGNTSTKTGSSSSPTSTDDDEEDGDDESSEGDDDDADDADDEDDSANSPTTASLPSPTPGSGSSSGSGSGSSSGSSSGSGSGSDSAESASSPTPSVDEGSGAAGSQRNSMVAGTIALVLAVAFI